jgi:predicted small metal-binding protein
MKKDILKKIECDSSCGFMIRSHNEEEMVEMAMKHAKQSHKMDLSVKDVKAMIEDAQAG